MNAYTNMQQTANHRQQQLTREAEITRLADRARAPHPASQRHVQPVLARVGDVLTDLGQVLVDRYGAAAPTNDHSQAA